MKIIIIGCGKVGTTLTEQLIQENHEITLIDTNQDVLELLSTRCDVMGVVGDGVSFHIQMEAGIQETDLLIAVTDSDEKNLLSCLMAKKAGNCKTIARVRNPIYYREMGFLREELGLSMIINPEEAAAKEIARLIQIPSAIKVDSFAKDRVELLHIKIPERSILNGCTVASMGQKGIKDVLICAVERKDKVTIPDGNFVLQEKDTISVIIPHQQANRFFERIGVKVARVKNAMIVGGSRLAYYLAEMLFESGVDVTIIEKEKSRCEELSEHFPKATIIHADGTSKEVLLEEGIASMDFFVALTNLDEENILLALFAQKNSNAKVVTKVNHLRFEDVIADLNLGSVIYPKYVMANSIIQYVRAKQNSLGSNIETLYKIIDNRAEAIAFRIRENCPITNITFQEMQLKDNLLICCIIRNQQIITPRGQDVIKVGDMVIVVTTHTGLNDIKDILKEG